MRDADMNELANSRRGGRIKHDTRICHRRVEALTAVRKPDPVGIEERAGALETSLQSVGAIEIERHRFDLVAKWIRALRMSCQRPDATALSQKHARDVSAGVSGCAGDNVEVSLWHSESPSNRALLRDSSLQQLSL